MLRTGGRVFSLGRARAYQVHVRHVYGISRLLTQRPQALVRDPLQLAIFARALPVLVKGLSVTFFPQILNSHRPVLLYRRAKPFPTRLAQPGVPGK